MQQSPTEMLAIDRYDHREQNAKGVYLQRYEDGRLVERVDFDHLVWNEAAEVWYGADFTIRRFGPDQDSTKWVDYGTDTLITLALNPFYLTRMFVTS